jgi:hypothetical protein
LEYIGAYNTIDVRGSLTFKGYKRVEAEYLAPRLLARQATLSIIGGWREATQVGYYGLGNNTTADARANYAFQQPYLSTTFTVRPADRIVVLRAGFETSQWIQDPGSGDVPSVEQIYTPATLPGLGTSVIYLHSQGTVGIDSRARQAIRGEADSMASRFTTSRIPIIATASRRSTTRRCSMCRSSARRGSFRFAVFCRRRRRRATK